MDCVRLIISLHEVGSVFRASSLHICEVCMYGSVNFIGYAIYFRYVCWHLHVLQCLEWLTPESLYIWIVVCIWRYIRINERCACVSMYGVVYRFVVVKREKHVWS